MRRTPAIAETFQLFPIVRRVEAEAGPIRDAYKGLTSFGSRSEHAPEEFIQFAGDAIDLRIPELAEGTDRTVVLEGNLIVVILTQKYPDRRVQGGREGVPGHRRSRQRIADVVLDGLRLNPAVSSPSPWSREPKNERGVCRSRRSRASSTFPAFKNLV